MVIRALAPDRGDLVWVDFGPALGHEQSGRRPALVISLRAYNQKVGLFLACPVTSRIKGYSLEVALESENLDGVVLVDQVKSLDWRIRPFEPIGIAKPEVVGEVLAKLRAIID